jgi:hypothetical protein
MATVDYGQLNDSPGALDYDPERIDTCSVEAGEDRRDKLKLLAGRVGYQDVVIVWHADESAWVAWKCE